MFKIFVSLFLLIIILVVNSQTPTSCTTSFKDSNGVTHYYDFSAFMKKSTENPYIYEDLDNKYTYLFNICANVDNIVTCPCCTPSLATGWVIEAVNVTNCDYMGELENPVYTPIDSDDLEDGINLRYFVDYNGKHIRSMFYNLFCSNYETWRVVTVFYHSTLLPPSMEINVLTSSTCFNTQPVPVITQSCSKCNAAGASFGVISALCFGVISGFFFYKWRSKEISTTYERV